jgi:hypothetical protein
MNSQERQRMYEHSLQLNVGKRMSFNDFKTKIRPKQIACPPPGNFSDIELPFTTINGQEIYRVDRAATALDTLIITFVNGPQTNLNIYELEEKIKTKGKGVYETFRSAKETNYKAAVTRQAKAGREWRRIG